MYHTVKRFKRLLICAHGDYRGAFNVSESWAKSALLNQRFGAFYM